MKALVAVVLFTAIALAGQNSSAPRSDEAAVREADQAWAEAVGSKSVEQTLAFYAPDAVTAGSAMFPAHGLADFRTAWTDIFAQPGFELTWEVEKVVVSKSGSIAYSSGTWNDGKQHGPYLAVWQKQSDGQWKLIIDSAWYMR